MKNVARAASRGVAPRSRSAIGFRVKSGYAIAVILAGPAGRPTAVARRLVALSDPDAAETRQPYHHGFYQEEQDARELTRRVKVVTRSAKQSVAALLKDACLDGQPCRGAGLVVGSVIDPRQVGNPHIRAHASEGQLFRTVLEDALRSHGISCGVLVEKQLAATAAADLRRPAGEIARVLTGFGKVLGRPWRADEKAASIAAWLALGRR
jgi:hypothetical protein